MVFRNLIALLNASLIRAHPREIRVLNPRKSASPIRVLIRVLHHGQMDILVTQGRLASRPYNFGINAVKKNISHPRPHPRPSA
jgi:hypothetical protein